MDIIAILAAYAAKYPVAASIFMVIGVLRAIMKPLFSLFHAYVAATPSVKDDEVLAKAEASKAYKAIAYVLDYVGSIKVGPQAPQ